ncbi:uncharacterized protein DSM5745_07173 [Aspergillus mulundensis]|uniref:Uncharacterized protein n=1 Tax=Aspergillus mulundensis TaxID=1810919 RepID=A0A3D8RL18_9EURO|nr:hypothetical protein DSM5745_07173 [Aspergillus mulundensis]RDW74511.1 hypothetical protein DSM5745_07173 [Aspergillus mulundensis]
MGASNGSTEPANLAEFPQDIRPIRVAAQVLKHPVNGGVKLMPCHNPSSSLALSAASVAAHELP